MNICIVEDKIFALQDPTGLSRSNGNLEGFNYWYKGKFLDNKRLPLHAFIPFLNRYSTFQKDTTLSFYLSLTNTFKQLSF